MDRPEAEDRDLSEYSLEQLAGLVADMRADEDSSVASVSKIA